MVESQPIWDRDLTEKVVAFLGVVILISILLYFGTPEATTAAISAISGVLGFLLENFRQRMLSKGRDKELQELQQAMTKALAAFESGESTEAYKLLESSRKKPVPLSK